MAEERKLFDRLLSAQSRIGIILKDMTNPFFKSNYADINTIIDMVKPILNEEGLLVLQPLSHVNGKPAIQTVIMYKGDAISETTVIPEDPNPQKMGSSITYFRRYALQSMLCLQAADDDGNTAAQPSAPKKEQPKAQQPDGAKEIPTCSICKQPMRAQAGNPDKYFCKHVDNNVTKWGKPVYIGQ